MADINIRVGASISDLEKKLKQAEYSLKRSGAKMQSIGSSLMMSLTAPIAAFSAGSVKAAGDFEAMSNGLTAIMGDSDKAAAELEKLKEAAKNPGLGFEQAVKGSVRLQSIGLDADLARQNMLAMGNAIALVGGGAEELDRATLAMQQIGAKGKVSAEEINQLNEVIPQIRAVMNETFGTSDGEELAKMGVDANTFIEQITLGLEKLPTATGGINNAIENAGIAMRTFLVTIGDELNETFNLQENVEAFSAKLDEIATKFQGLDADTQKLIITIGGVVAAIGPLIYAYGAAQSFAGELIGSYRMMSRDLAKLAVRLGIVTPAQVGLNTVMAANPILIVVVAVAALSAALAYLYKNNEDVRKAMDNLYKNVLTPLFENVLKPLGLFLFEFGKIYVSVMVEFYKQSFKVFKAVGGLVANLIKKFVGFLESFPLIGNALKWLKERFTQAIEFIGKVIQNLPAFFAGLTAEVKNTGDKIKAFFTRLALTAQIVAKKVEKALTIDKAKRQQLTKEISDLSKEKEAAGEVGKEFGVAFREGYAAELQRQTVEAVQMAKPKDEDVAAPSTTTPFVAPAVVDTKAAEEAAKAAEKKAKAEQKEYEATRRKNDELNRNAELLTTLNPIQSTTEKLTKAMATSNNSLAHSQEKVTQTFGEGYHQAAKYLDELAKLNQSMTDLAYSGINDLAVGLGESIGAMATGQGNLQTLASTMLGTIGGVLEQLGKLAIQTGVALLSIKVALKSLNPAVAIAGGIALVALASVVKSKASSLGEAGQASLPAFANGGLVTSPTLGLFGEAGPEALIPKKRLDSLLARAESGGTGEGMLTTRISGNDLEIVLDKTRRRNNRVR